ncbi:hypothetical protein KV203_16375 [Skermania piniformis]|uniref:Transposase n=1 Tax=Skermania pinensis TaxID=39122 RepID=A0ABX8SDN1_9ACTN|nr:hypothetical protein [Skermania piniformis]QXQ15999.1 hypothetical protein KV203_16375 [Skermania piniformis]
MRLDAVRDELYGGLPSDFVRVRTERARQARAAGDKSLATAIGRLRRPTQVAWAVNLLARERPDDVAALLDLGAALRDAQRQLSATQLRGLSTQRQQVVRAMAAQAGRLAAERGAPLGPGAIRDVGQTLHAALADPAVGDQVRAAVLATGATYDGFGPSGLVVVADPVGDAGEPTPEPPREPDRSAAAQAELAAADAALATARTESAEVAGRAAELGRRLTEIDAAIADLREQLDRAEQERQFVRSAERSASETRRTAERAVEQAERRARSARDALDDLR